MYPKLLKRVHVIVDMGKEKPSRVISTNEGKTINYEKHT